VNASTVADVLLIGAAVAWVLARQVQLARVKPRLLVLAPLVLASFGIRSPACLDLAGARRSRAARSERGAVAGAGVWRAGPIKACHEPEAVGLGNRSTPTS
jgi:hypothetical protein